MNKPTVLKVPQLKLVKVTPAHDIDSYLHAKVVNQINQGKTTIYFKGSTLLTVRRVRHLTLIARPEPTT